MSKKKSKKIIQQKSIDPKYLWDADDVDAFDVKYEEWLSRDWEAWFSKHLSFPFTVNREEDLDSFGDDDKDDPFRVGAIFQVTGIAYDKATEWFFARVVAPTGEEAHVPLADLEVRPKTNLNYWPVREYAVWAANM